MATKDVLKRWVYSCGVCFHRFTTLSGYNYEFDLRHLVGRRHGVVCVDVGANRGQTIEMLTRAFARPAILAFEPTHELAEKLKQRRWAGEVRVVERALGSKDESREFVHYRADDLNSLLTMSARAFPDFGNQEMGRSLVDVTTLDAELVRAGMAQIDFLKIDTQGFDLEVLKGARGILEKRAVRIVSVELNLDRLYEGQGPWIEIVQYLDAMGMQLVDFYEKWRRPDHGISWCTALFTRRAQD